MRTAGRISLGDWDPTKGKTVVTQVAMDDGTESTLEDHMRDAHQKGTRGFTEDYLAGLHRTLHQRKHEPDIEPEHPHTHPGSMGVDESADRDQPASAKEQPSSGGEKHKKAKDRRQENRKHADRKHVDRYHGAGGRTAEEVSSH
jgi:hypothetical protein